MQLGIENTKNLVVLGKKMLFLQLLTEDVACFNPLMQSEFFSLFAAGASSQCRHDYAMIPHAPIRAANVTMHLLCFQIITFTH